MVIEEPVIMQGIGLASRCLLLNLQSRISTQEWVFVELLIIWTELDIICIGVKVSGRLLKWEKL